MRTATLTAALAAYLFSQSTTASVYPLERPQVEHFLTVSPCDEIATATTIAVSASYPQPVGQGGANAVPADIGQKHNGQDHNEDGNNGIGNEHIEANSGQENGNDNAGIQEPEDVTIIVTHTREHSQPSQERVVTELSFVTTTFFATGEAPTVTITPLAQVITQVQVVTVTASGAAPEPVTITATKNAAPPAAVTVTETFVQPARTVTLTESETCAMNTPAPEAVTTQNNNVAGGSSNIAASEVFPSEIVSPTFSDAAPVISSDTRPGVGKIGEHGECNCECLCDGDVFISSLASDIIPVHPSAASETTNALDTPKASTETVVEASTPLEVAAAPAGEFFLDSTLLTTPLISSMPFASAFADAAAPPETAEPSESVIPSMLASSILSTLNLSDTTTGSAAADTAAPFEPLISSMPASSIPSILNLPDTTTGSPAADTAAQFEPLISSMPASSILSTLNLSDTTTGSAVADTAAPSEPLISSMTASSIPSTLNLSGTTTAPAPASEVTPEEILLDSVTFSATFSPEAAPSGESGDIFITDALLEGGAVGAIPAPSAFSEMPTPVVNLAEAVVTNAPIAAGDSARGGVQGEEVDFSEEESDVLGGFDGEFGEGFDISTYSLSSALVLGNLGG